MTLSGLNFPFSLRAAVGGEGAPGGAAALPGAVDVGLDGLDVDKIGRLGTVPGLAAIAVAVATTLATVVVPVSVSVAVVTSVPCVVPVTRIAGAAGVAGASGPARIPRGVVVGAQAAPGEALDPRRPLPDAADGDGDAVEARRPLAPQRAEHGVLREPGILGYLLLPVGELPVGIGDLGIHRREFAVDLAACLLGHLAQFVTGIGTVDGGHLAAHVLGPGGRRGGRPPFPRGGVDIDRHQPAPAEDQGGGGGYGPVGQAGAFLAGRTGRTGGTC